MTEDKQKHMTPEIRFKGFSDDWEQRKLKEIAEFNPKSILPDDFEYVDLESVMGTTLVSHRTENKNSAPSRAQRLAQKGDIFYQTVRPYQKNNYFFDLDADDYVFSTGYAQIRPHYSSEFLMACIQEEKFVRTVLDNSTGTSYPAINSNDLANIKVSIPEPDEQVLIGKFFVNLDSAITLHQQKYDLLLKFKQAYLNLLFPEKDEKVPKVRFADFNSNWEQKKLSEVGYFARDSINPQDTPNDDFIEYSMPAYDNGRNPQRVLGNSMQSLRLKIIGNVLLINKLNVRQRRIWLVENATGNSVASSEFMPFTSDKISLSFLEQLLLSNRVTVDLESISSGTSNSQKRIIPSDMLKYRINLPVIPSEQQKIGSFFRILDHIIGSQEQKLDSLKSLKQAYLQKMFV